MNSKVEVEKKLFKNKFCQCTVVAVMFKIQFLILDYCSCPITESCLFGVILTFCFKVILIVVLSGYVIRLSSQ